jgi:hypothetical protein
MNSSLKRSIAYFTALMMMSSACSTVGETESTENREPVAPVMAEAQPSASPTPVRPNLQAEILDDRFKTTSSPFSSVDFQNYSYPLPRGWQNPDASDLVLTAGRLDPVSADMNEDMSGEERIEQRSKRRIGASYVTTRYFDATGDGLDEAFVILKIETTGSAIPQIVYVFTLKEDKPELIWYFRTGDRADGGLKDLRPDHGDLVVELYGQDRFLLGETETGKVTGDEEQICCPTFFTRTRYKWNGNVFRMHGKRLTFSVADPAARPIENMAELIEKQLKSGKK